MNLQKGRLTLSTMALLDPGQVQQLEGKYVTRTVRCVPDKFTQLCHMHLAFLLDLSGDKLEMLLSTPDEHKKKRSRLMPDGVFRRKEKSQTDLFGTPLTDSATSIIMKLISFLTEEKNMCKEGLFRKPGNKNRMVALRELLERCNSPAVNIDEEVYSPYDVACVLKEFLRELPEPLVTERYMEAHRQVITIGQHADSPEEVARCASKKLSALQLLMLLLPPPAQKLTRSLLSLLHRISNCQETKMTPATLGTIFAPIFFINRNTAASELCGQIAETARAVSFMIEKAEELLHAPRELVVDLTNYWNTQISPSEELVQGGDPMKTIGGYTVNTGVSYIDREKSRVDDVTNHTQAELSNLLLHIQSLPNTPKNIKLKKQVLKKAATSATSAGKYSKNKFVGNSVMKRLPYLSRKVQPKDSRAEMFVVANNQQVDQSVSCGGKVAVVHCQQLDSLHQESNVRCQEMTLPSISELLESPGHLPQQPSPQTRRWSHHASHDVQVSTDPGCSPPKQERKDVVVTGASPLVTQPKISNQTESSTSRSNDPSLAHRSNIHTLDNPSIQDNTASPQTRVASRARGSSFSPRDRVRLRSMGQSPQNMNRFGSMRQSPQKRTSLTSLGQSLHERIPFKPHGQSPLSRITLQSQGRSPQDIKTLRSTGQSPKGSSTLRPRGQSPQILRSQKQQSPQNIHILKSIDKQQSPEDVNTLRSLGQSSNGSIKLRPQGESPPKVLRSQLQSPQDTNTFRSIGQSPQGRNTLRSWVQSPRNKITMKSQGQSPLKEANLRSLGQSPQSRITLKLQAQSPQAVRSRLQSPHDRKTVKSREPSLASPLGQSPQVIRSRLQSPHDRKTVKSREPSLASPMSRISSPKLTLAHLENEINYLPQNIPVQTTVTITPIRKSIRLRRTPLRSTKLQRTPGKSPALPQFSFHKNNVRRETAI